MRNKRPILPLIAALPVLWLPSSETRAEGRASLSIPESASLLEAYQEASHAVRPVDDPSSEASHYWVQNPGHGLNARFTPEGMILSVKQSAQRYQSRWRTVGVGYGGQLRELPAGTLRVGSGEEAGNRVEIVREALVEWYVNRPEGLEQGWTLPAAPAGREPGQPLRLELQLEGDLSVRLESGDQEVSLRNAAGDEVLRYAKLKVWDAEGREFPARLSGGGTSLFVEVEEAGAAYPLVIDPVFFQQTYLKASNAESSDWFGHSVAISGNTAVVGAPWEDSTATGINNDQGNNDALDAGAAYVFVRNRAGKWEQQAYLKASNTEADDQFGYSVAISGDTIAVGALYEASSDAGVNGNENDNGAPYSGAVYVYVRSASGIWSKQAYLKASNAEDGDFFGHSVAISRDTIVVGAHQERSNATEVNGNQFDNSAPEAGAAYVFVRENGQWTQQAYLKASNTDAYDQFGYSVAIDSDTIVVGAKGESSNTNEVNGDEDDNSAPEAGAAYVFVRENGQWTQQAYLKAPNPDVSDVFGISVAVSGDLVVVGAPGESSNATGVNGYWGNNDASGSGAVYVFGRVFGNQWVHQAYLKASNTEMNDAFGSAVAISGNLIVVGAPGEDGNAVGVNGNPHNNAALAAGAAYVYRQGGNGAWTPLAYLKASNTGGGDGFGAAVSISGSTVLVGAAYEDSNATEVDGPQDNDDGENSGAAYLYRLLPPASLWLQSPKRFPAVTLGKKSRQQALRIMNRGGSPMTGLKVKLTGRAKRDFKLSPPRAKALAAGAATKCKLRFRPRAAGVRKAKLKVLGQEVPSVERPIKGKGVEKG